MEDDQIKNEIRKKTVKKILLLLCLCIAIFPLLKNVIEDYNIDLIGKPEGVTLTKTGKLRYLGGDNVAVILQVIKPGYALATGYYNTADTDIFLIKGNRRSGFYDGLTISPPGYQSWYQIGTYTYQTVLGTWKTVPVIKIGK